MANMRTVNVYNVTLTVANTEYSQALPPNVRSFAVQPRTAVDVRMAFVTGKVAGSTAPFFTLKAGGALAINELQMGDDATVSLASATAGTVVEIVAGSW